MVHKVKGYVGPISNKDIAQVYGEDLLVAADTERWLSPGNTTLDAPNFPSDEGELFDVISDNAGDTGTVRIDGLGVDFLELVEDVEITGGLATRTTKTFTRVNNILWLEKTASAGTIEVTDTTGAVVYMTRNQQAQIVLDAVHTVAADRRWQATQIYAGITKDSGSQSLVDVFLYVGDIGYYFQRPFKFPAVTNGNSVNSYINELTNEYPGPTDFYLTGVSSDINVEIVSRFSLLQRSK